MPENIFISDTDLGPLYPFGLGTTAAGLKWDGPDADRLFDLFTDHGGNVIDTARVYSDWVPGVIGRSELTIGQWLKRSGKRHQVVLMTKGGHASMQVMPPDMHKVRLSREEMGGDLDLSLKALGTDYIDIYMYHRDDERRPVEELVDTMEDFVRQGKIRYYGCSNWNQNRMMAAVDYCRQKGYRGFVANEVLFNIGTANMNPPMDDTLVWMDMAMRKWHKANPQILPLAYFGNCGGFFQQLIEGGASAVRDPAYLTPGNEAVAKRIVKLTEKYDATILQVVLGFFTRLDFACMPLFGPRNAGNLAEAMNIFQIPFENRDFIGL